MAIESKSKPEEPSVATDEITIDQKIRIELDKTQYKALKIGFFINIISGMVVVWVMLPAAPLYLLLSWLAVLILVNVANVLWLSVYETKEVTYQEFDFYRRISRYIFIALCVTWGSMGVLFNPVDPHYQMYLIAFLLAVVVAYTFASVTDFTAALISLSCLLIPTIIWQMTKGIHAIATTGHDPDLNLGLGIALLLLSSFLLIGCYIGSKWIIRFFRLTFENIALSKKLENMNKFLEQRVRERTAELEKSLKLVTYQATHDLLTNLPNQRLLLKYVQTAIKTAQEKKCQFALISFSLNELEKINDGLGHQVGDLVIRTIAHRFQAAFNKPLLPGDEHRYTVTLSRKDVFVILLEPIKFEEAERHAKFLFSLLEEPIYTEKQVLKLTASIGMSLYPEDGNDIKTLLMNADAAMLEAKQQGGNSLNIYKAEINADISKQLEMDSSLHSAILNSEFVLQYQPFVDVKTGRICGAEALVRWNHPVLGFIPPDHFIPLAESNGIIIPLGEWVLRTACAQTKKWHDLGFDSLKVAINLSAKQLQQKNIVKVIATILQELDLNPAYIELELTETEAFKEDVIPVLKQFKAMGLGLSIDDFGTGYSGLTNLKLIDIDKLKIDKSFVQDLMTNSDSRVIVANTITLAKKIDVTVLAEGVETIDELRFLKENGCDLIQGYYFSKPIYADVFTELLESKTKFVI